MIRKLFILILALSISTQVHVNAADPELGEVAQPPKKKSKMEAKAKPEVSPVPDEADMYRSNAAEMAKVPEDKVSEVAINMHSRHRKDVVVKLDLSGNGHLTDITFTLGFPCLIELNLSLCYNLGNNYKQASSLTKLTTLNLRAISLTELHHVSSFKTLTSLDLSNNNLKETIKYLISLKELKTLNLRLNQDITDLERLPELKSLTSLNLSRAIIYDSDDSYKSIDFLAGMKTLVKLDLSFNDAIEYIKPLTKIPTLAKLYLCGCHSVKDFENLRKIKHLEKLDLSYVDLTPERLIHLSNLGHNHKHIKKLIVKKQLILPKSIILIEM